MEMQNNTNVEEGENLPKKVEKYPKAVFFIVTNEFCERFSYYGMRTVLILYLKWSLNYSDDVATVLFHAFVMLCYFTPLFGAIISDSWLGKFRTILYISIIYATGNIALSVASIGLKGFPQVQMSFLGLFLIALGTGGIKPCVSAFGGDQFKLPEQERQLQRFFSLFYFCINAGSTISTLLTPILREDVHCLGRKECYPLAFGIPAILMIISLVIFVFGKPLYKIQPPLGNVLFDVVGCIFGSRWTIQATKLNGQVGSFVIKPDQMQILNPILILVFIPLFDMVIYPLLAKRKILTRSLQRIIAGGFLAAVAFFVSGVIESAIEKSDSLVSAEGFSRINLMNGMNCAVEINTSWNKETNTLLPFSNKIFTDLPAGKTHEMRLKSAKDSMCDGSFQEKYSVLRDNLQNSAAFIYSENNATVTVTMFEDDITKKSNNVQVRLHYSSDEILRSVQFIDADNKSIDFKPRKKLLPTPYVSLTQLRYDVLAIDKNNVTINLGAVYFLHGGIYNVFVTKQPSLEKYLIVLYEVAPPNKLHITLMIPQYILITVAEVMLSITCLEFSFTQSNEYFLFGTLMILDMLFFCVLSYFYKYRKQEDEIDHDKEDVSAVVNKDVQDVAASKSEI